VTVRAVLQSTMGDNNQLTRAQVALRLGVSSSTVRRMEGVCLHPTQDHRGTWLFAVAEVSALLATTPHATRRPRASRAPSRGEIAARVFRLLSRGCSLRQIVVQTRQPPVVVRQLYREWMTNLSDGERQRRERNEADRIRQECAEDARIHVELMKTLQG
jgi:hypothetical protein